MAGRWWLAVDSRWSAGSLLRRTADRDDTVIERECVRARFPRPRIG